MKLQEKMDWFWSLGTLPGTIFDDLDDRRVGQSWESCRRRFSRLRTGTRKHSGKLLEWQRDHRLSPSKDV